MKKYYVHFKGGQACDGVSGCNYLLVDCVNRDGDDVRLYAEYLIPKVELDDNDKIFNCDEIKQFLKGDYTLEDAYEMSESSEWFDIDKFDMISYPVLKDEILKRAEEFNVDPETIDFGAWDDRYLHNAT